MYDSIYCMLSLKKMHYEYDDAFYGFKRKYIAPSPLICIGILYYVLFDLKIKHFGFYLSYGIMK